MQVLSEDNFKVLIKVRPLQAKEKEEIQSYDQAYCKKLKGSSGGKPIKLPPAAYAFYTKFYNSSIHEIIKIDESSNTIFIADPEYKNTDRKMKPFMYSAVFGETQQNEAIFNHQLQDHVKSVLDGYNCTILAYGITGSGKTYTIFGPTRPAQPEAKGISYQAFSYLLAEKERLRETEQTKISFRFSFIEIYNENVRDLLLPSDSKYLNVVQDSKGATTVADVTQVEINCLADIVQCISSGTAKRVFASTMANQYSSRSHAILQLSVEIERSNEEKANCKLFIIDLAGSEKLQSLNCTKKMQEGANINRSLLALGNCINILAENSRKSTTSHIPYRDSKLTRMLKDSLGGNTKTVMIACITPNPFLIEETMTTLNYAMRAQGIQKKIVRNSTDEGEKEKQFLCLRCRRESKRERSCESEENRVENKDKQQEIKEAKESGEIEMRKFPNLELIEQFYEDLVENIRENEKIHIFSNTNLSHDSEWLKLKDTNEEQGRSLKDVFMKLMAAAASGKRKTRASPTLADEGVLESAQNKENEGRSSIRSLNNSKSRRRRSHNKFEVPRRSDSQCRNGQTGEV